MKAGIILFAVTVSTVSAFVPAIDEALVYEINSDPSSTWIAHMSDRFYEHSMEDAQHLLGTFIDPEVMIHLPDRNLVHPEEAFSVYSSQDIPEEFDSRIAWPHCASVIGHIRDQANCGSCWAFASTEAFNDRLCIVSEGKFATLLSPMDTLNCCGFFKCQSFGCKGGQPSMAWRYFKNHGVVTGGDYSDIGSGNTCAPYQFESCSHHGVDPDRRSCHETEHGKAQGCMKICNEDTYANSYKEDKYYTASAYSLESEEAIQRDIMTYGPVSAAFSVYDTFLLYESGVYQHPRRPRRVLGGHAVKIIGWGVENGVKYWEVVNSWNEKWGDNGTFKMIRGDHDCGLASTSVNAGKVIYKKAKKELNSL